MQAPTSRLALLDHVCVQPIWQRRGLGKRLVTGFETEIRAAGYSGWVGDVRGFGGGAAALARAAGAHPSAEVVEKSLQAPT